MATAQSEKDLQSAANETCKCLEKQTIPEKISQEEMQLLFAKCFMEGAPSLVVSLATADDPQKAGEELGAKLVMKMMADGCAPMMKIMKSSMGGPDFSSGEENVISRETDFTDSTFSGEIENLESVSKTTEGTVVKVETGDFLYITIKTGAGRELKFIYYNYIPNSDEWVRAAGLKLMGKSVSIEYEDTEVYQAKTSDFGIIRVLRSLQIQ
jgi:hypothetical protein